LDVDNFFNTGPAENVVAATNSFSKAEPPQQMAKIVKVNVRIGFAEQYLFPQFVPLAH
jgi:hypothetical protein